MSHGSTMAQIFVSSHNLKTFPSSAVMLFPVTLTVIA